MVNVSKLMGLAGEALSAVKRAPMVQKTAMAAIFGAGAMTGALINCDGFEKEEAKAPTEQVAKKATTKPKAESTNSTQLQNAINKYSKMKEKYISKKLPN